MAKSFRLNAFLTNRGFINTTPNYGYGKTNATWKNKTITVKRSSNLGSITISIIKNGTILKSFNINKQNRETEVQNFKDYILTL